jgi:hypothetical protein
MAITNHERIGKSLEQLAAGLKPFVERDLKSAYQNQWFAETKKTLSATQVEFLGTAENPEWDVASLLATLWNQWNDVFRKVLGPVERSLVSELRDVRNKWAHHRTFSTDDSYRALDTMERLLNAVSAPKEAEEIGRHKAELLRLKFDEQARHERRKTTIEGHATAGLRPWREVVTPHKDVASGHYQQAEFAADLWQVYKRQASSEYGDPIEFFRRTFLTQGLTDLLTKAVRRLAGQGSDPVVELQTNFGGGKTHSMLALYHLFSGNQQKDFPGLEPVFETAKCDLVKGVKRVVIVGNKISPGQPDQKDDGTIVRTLWGELAWQLGGKEGFAMVKQADETATNPGDALGKLLRKYSPCLILIDEWVAYARQLHEKKDLPGGDFETQFTFAQTLSEEIKSARQGLVVVSIPASSEAGASPSADINDEEVGGAKGREALTRLRNVFQRIATQWRPANVEESFEIVRRRLFQPIDEATRFYLAWASIERDKEELGLDGFRVRQVSNQKANWNTAIQGRLGETFCWLLFPSQSTPQAPLEWQAVKLSGNDPLAARASKKLRSETQMVPLYAPTLLRQDLDKIPLWRDQHVTIKQLVEDYAKYPYLQRLRGPEVLIAGIQDGVLRMTWTSETFAIADSWDEQRQRYIGLRANCHVTVDPDSSALLVKPNIALRQLEAEKPTSATTPGNPTDGTIPSQTEAGKETGGGKPNQPTKPTHFFGSVRLDPARLNRDAAQISAEIVHHLASVLGAEVDVTLDIQVRAEGGIPDNVVRTVSENCRTLKFKDHGFEKE